MFFVLINISLLTLCSDRVLEGSGEKLPTRLPRLVSTVFCSLILMLKVRRRQQ